MFNLIVSIIFGLMLLTMLTRVLLPLRPRQKGTLIKEISLPLRQRLFYHRVSLYMIGITMLLGGVGRWLALPFQIGIVAIAFCILLLPVRYIFTTEGVALNNVTFRRWQEFNQVGGTSRLLQLSGKKPIRPFTILLVPSHWEETSTLATQFVQEANKPQAQPAKRPGKSSMRVKSKSIT